MRTFELSKIALAGAGLVVAGGCRTGTSGSSGVKEFGDNAGDIFYDCKGTDPAAAYDHGLALLPSAVQVQFNAAGSEFAVQYGIATSHIYQAASLALSGANFVATSFTLLDDNSHGAVKAATLTKAATQGALKGTLILDEIDNQGGSRSLHYTCKGKHEGNG